jgi:phospholipase/carboxylesterase
MGPDSGATGAVIWLHGLGASGHDFEDVVPMMGLSRVRFVLPHAPQRPVTINGGLIMPAWFDMTGLGGGGESERHVREGFELVSALIAREVSRGVPASRIALAGFSQGGAVALFTGVRYPETLAGIVVLSAAELLPATREAELHPANAATPILFCHGSHDPLVAVERGRAAYLAYNLPPREAAWHEFPMQHAVCLEEIELVRDWLQARLD